MNPEQPHLFMSWEQIQALLDAAIRDVAAPHQLEAIQDAMLQHQDIRDQVYDYIYPLMHSPETKAAGALLFASIYNTAKF
jgi:hypothetical protein